MSTYFRQRPRRAWHQPLDESSEYDCTHVATWMLRVLLHAKAYRRVFDDRDPQVEEIVQALGLQPSGKTSLGPASQASTPSTAVSGSPE